MPKVFPPEGAQAVPPPREGYGIILSAGYAADSLPGLRAWMREQGMECDLFGIYDIQVSAFEARGVLEGGLFMFRSNAHRIVFRLMVDECRGYDPPPIT